MPVKSPKHETCENCISVSNVSFHYGDNQVLEDVNFEVHCGDYVGLIGPNGSGKTTLLKIILGILEPSEGGVKMFGHPVRQLPNKSEIGYVPQRVAQSDWQFPASVQEIIESGRTPKLGLRRTLNAKDRKAIEKAIKVTGVDAYRDRLIGQLSGGERQRVFIARALAGEPKVLILDEPTVGVDLESQEKFYTLLCELNKKHDLTVILVSHDIDVVAQEVKTVIFLNKTVIAHGTPKELLKEGALEKLYSDQMKLIVHKH